MQDIRLPLIIDGAGEAIKNVDQLENQVESLTEELKQTEIGSQRFKELSKELGVARGELRRMETQLDQLDPVGRAEGFVKMSEGVAGSFAIMTGAQAAFGIESEKVAELEAKAQGAVAIATGLRAIQEANLIQLLVESRAAKLANAAAEKVLAFAMGGTTKAAKLLRVALISTGIGAIVVLVGALIANWEKVTNLFDTSSDQFKEMKETLKQWAPPLFLIIEGAEKLQERFGGIKQFLSGLIAGIKEFFTQAVSIVGSLLTFDFDAAGDKAKEFGANITEAFNEGVAEKQAEIDAELLRERLAAEVKINERVLKERQALGEDTTDLERKLLQDRIAILEEGTDEYLDAQTELQVFENNLLKERNEREAAARQARVEAARKERQEREEIQAEFYEKLRVQGLTEEQRQIEAIDSELERYRQAGVDAAEIERVRSERIAEIRNAQLEEEAKRTQEAAERLLQLQQQNTLAAIEDANQRALLELEIEYNKQLEELQQYENFLQLKAELDIEYARKRGEVEAAISQANKAANDEQVRNDAAARSAQFNLAVGMLGDIAGLLNEGSKAYKAVKIAEIAMSTYQGALAAYTQAVSVYPPPAGPIVGGIQAGIVVAKGALAARSVLSTNPSTGGGGASISGSGLASAPSVSASPDFSFLQGNQEEIAPGQQAGASTATAPAARAYVVSQDMTTQQAKDQELDDLTSL